MVPLLCWTASAPALWAALAAPPALRLAPPVMQLRNDDGTFRPSSTWQGKVYDESGKQYDEQGKVIDTTAQPGPGGRMPNGFPRRPVTLHEKVAALRSQLSLPKGLSLSETVMKAVEELGLPKDEERGGLMQTVDACLAMIGSPDNPWMGPDAKGAGGPPPGQEPSSAGPPQQGPEGPPEQQPRWARNTPPIGYGAPFENSAFRRDRQPQGARYRPGAVYGYGGYGMGGGYHRGPFGQGGGGFGLPFGNRGGIQYGGYGGGARYSGDYGFGGYPGAGYRYGGGVTGYDDISGGTRYPGGPGPQGAGGAGGPRSAASQAWWPDANGGSTGGTPRGPGPADVADAARNGGSPGGS